MESIDNRQYRITAVLGEGGFGKVYRATMLGHGGFSKDVALKLMRDDDVPEETLQRFRDEARILGLVRDRAVVHVDAPTRLGGRWAVVMEYVDGSSVRQLLELGPVPPGVAVEIIQEVARALGHVYRMSGPDGKPLHLLHRDIKPANIQVTGNGEIKILDFGVAKADFDEREARTTGHIGGTIGYIAPERLDGQEGPESDIFSLGVVLYQLITGSRPSRRELLGLEEASFDGLTPEAVLALKLSKRMRDPWPENRPTAREVEDLCAQLRRRVDGPSLRAWAEETVPKANNMGADDLVGSVLSETFAVPRNPPPAASGSSPLRMVAVAALLSMSVLLLSSGLASVLSGLGIGLLWMSSGQEAQQPALTIDDAPTLAETVAEGDGEAGEAPDTTPIEPEEPGNVEVADLSEAPDAEGAADPEVPGDADHDEPDVGDADEAPADGADDGADDAGVTQASPPKPRPSPRPAPVGRSYPVTFSSAPLGATVYLDGKKLGQTPLVDAKLIEGDRTVTMEANGERITRTIKVGRRSPTRYVWKGGAQWEQHY